MSRLDDLETQVKNIHERLDALETQAAEDIRARDTITYATQLAENKLEVPADFFDWLQQRVDEGEAA